LRTTELSRRGRLLAAGLLLIAAAACDDEKAPEDTTGGESTPLSVEQIVVSPRVGEPGDTLLFTALLTSSSGNVGDIPSLSWTASGGTFVEDDELTVRWEAPATGGLYDISVRATNAANSASGTTRIFIGAEQSLVGSDAGQVHLIAGGEDFYYFRSPDVSGGVDVNAYIGGVVSDAVNPVRANNLTVAYAPNGAFEVHAADSLLAGVEIRPRHIYVGTFATRILQRISFETAPDSLLRKSQFSFPAVSPNSQLIAFGGKMSGQSGTPDTNHVFVYELGVPRRFRATGLTSSRRNFFPSFSTDGAWLTFVSDQTGSGVWDLYGLPVNGNVVDRSPSSLKRLTDTGGTLVSGTPSTVKNPLKRWNPVTPILAVLASDGVLYLVQTTASGANVIDVPGVSAVKELAWSPGGSLLAVSSGAKITTVTPAGTASDVLEARSGDDVRDIAWSPDEEWLLYRVTRGGTSWFEILDLDAGVLTEPLPVTTTAPAGELVDYRNVMSMSPAWTNSNRMIYPVFGDLDTPGINSRDLSGLVD
jgi:hypothetical protein